MGATHAFRQTGGEAPDLDTPRSARQLLVVWVLLVATAATLLVLL
ncbi:hypothetical protein ACWDSJ_28505 [Nocardia sp. NPDC003482]